MAEHQPCFAPSGHSNRFVKAPPAARADAGLVQAGRPRARRFYKTLVEELSRLADGWARNAIGEARHTQALREAFPDFHAASIWHTADGEISAVLQM